jgi:hypothetical protein
MLKETSHIKDIIKVQDFSYKDYERSKLSLRVGTTGKVHKSLTLETIVNDSRKTIIDLLIKKEQYKRSNYSKFCNLNVSDYLRATYKTSNFIFLQDGIKFALTDRQVSDIIVKQITMSLEVHKPVYECTGDVYNIWDIMNRNADRELEWYGKKYKNSRELSEDLRKNSNSYVKHGLITVNKSRKRSGIIKDKAVRKGNGARKAVLTLGDL